MGETKSAGKPQKVYRSFDDWIDDLTINRVAGLLRLRPLTVWHWRARRGYPKVEHMQRIKKLTKGAVSYDMIIDRKLRTTGIR